MPRTAAETRGFPRMPSGESPSPLRSPEPVLAMSPRTESPPCTAINSILRATTFHRGFLTANTSAEFLVFFPSLFVLSVRFSAPRELGPGPAGSAGCSRGLTAGSSPARRGRESLALTLQTSARRRRGASAPARPAAPPGHPPARGHLQLRPSGRVPSQAPQSQAENVLSETSRSAKAWGWYRLGEDCGKAAPTQRSPHRGAFAHRRQRSAGAQGGTRRPGMPQPQLPPDWRSSRSSSWICTAPPQAPASGWFPPGAPRRALPPLRAPSPGARAAFGGERVASVLTLWLVHQCRCSLPPPSLPFFLSQSLPALSCLSERCSWKWAL